jgi:segregation and condensation protein B
METLALIAYRQPITRGQIEDIRGVSVSTNMINTLQERDWVKSLGHKEVPGRPTLYGTTNGFLDYFNLKSLNELPTLAEIRDIDQFNPEFSFDDKSAATTN